MNTHLSVSVSFKIPNPPATDLKPYALISVATLTTFEQFGIPNLVDHK